jgi:VanZ family protein
LSVLLGYGVELIQGSNLVRGRSYETNDVIADAIGGALGCIMYSLLYNVPRGEKQGI